MDLTVKNILLAAFMIVQMSPQILSKTLPKIGIIGGGIGGTSCAFYLKSLFGNELKIDIYEAEKVGGRLAVTTFGRNTYEIGGSIIHPRNKYMSDFQEMFRMKEKENDEGYFGLYNGKDFVFSQSEWQVVTALSMFWRYGTGYLKLSRHIDALLDKFDRIYDLQEDGYSFDNVTSLLAAMDPGFVAKLHIAAEHGFKEQGVPKIVVDEIVMATIRANYGQNNQVHTFVGSVSVAGGSGGLWAVQNGNLQVPQKLLEASKAKLRSEIVTGATRLSGGQIQIQVKERSDIPATKEDRTYDIVIIATPQTSDSVHSIAFKNFKPITFAGKYHRTVCTLVRGTLRENYFRDKSKNIDEILTTEDYIFFNSVGRINPIDYDKRKHSKSNVWKVFSQVPLSKTELTSLFSEVKDVFIKDWLAYPHYDTEPRNDKFVLDTNLYHVNAIEWAASAMEMSVIGARNVAILAHKNWAQVTEQEFPQEKIIRMEVKPENPKVEL